MKSRGIVPLTLSHPSRIFKKMWEAASDALLVSDGRGRILYANPSFLELSGFSPEDIEEKDITIIFPRYLRKEVLKQYRLLFKKKTLLNPINTAIQCADGSIKHIDARYNYLYKRRKRIAMISSIRDNTLQVLRESRREDYISTVRHEIKTPLATINAYVQLLEKYDKGKSSKTTEYFSNLHREIAKLNHLVSQAFDSKNTSLHFGYMLQVFDFDELIKECVNEKKELSRHHRIILEGKTRKKIIADREKIRLVCQSLIENAVNHSPDGNKITVRLEPQDRSVKLSVVNFGVGVSESMYQKLFNQSGNPEIRSSQAVDLPTSKDIIHAHGGRIDVINDIEKEATFFFELPINITDAECFVNGSSIR